MGDSHQNFAKVTIFDILLTFHWGMSRKKVVTFVLLKKY